VPRAEKITTYSAKGGKETMTTAEKVAYLKGLAEGLGLDKETKEGKIITVIMDILGEMASDIEDLEENSYEIGEALDQVSDDLSDVESVVYDEWDDDDEDDWDDDEDDECCCVHCHKENDEEPIFYEVTCPKCNNTITIDEDVLDLGSIECPNCGEELEFDGIEEDDETDE
jgi:ribosomal protein S27E